MYAFKLEPKISAEEYLERERKADFRSEWHDGVIIRMAGASEEHIDIVDNLTFGIRSGLKDKTCRTAAHDLRVKLARSYVYPDVDRGWKLTEYRQLPSVQEIVHVYQDRIQVDCYNRQSERRWLYEAYINLDSELVLASLAITLPLRELYANVGPVEIEEVPTTDDPA
jgi:Uma2 family endonuclease